MAKEVLSQYSQQYTVVIHADKRPSGEHEGRFNAPTSTEVAILTLGQEHLKRDIVLRHKRHLTQD